MRDPKIARTSNQLENYYRQTLPKAYKRKYKTIKGLINYLKLKMQNWTQKQGKISNPQQLDNPDITKDSAQVNKNMRTYTILLIFFTVINIFVGIYPILSKIKF
jgi:gamma-glutamylcysteine synthetase